MPSEMPSPSPRTLSASRRGSIGARDKILSAALELIVNRGAIDLKTKDIITEANVSRATLYRHFPGREELLEGVFSLAGERLFRELEAAMESTPDVDRRIDVVFDWIGGMLRSGIIDRLMKTDVDFIIELVRRVNAAGWPAFDAALAPVYARAEATFGVRANAAIINDIITRLHVSYGLFPPVASVGDPGQILKMVFQTLISGLSVRMPPAPTASETPSS